MSLIALAPLLSGAGLLLTLVLHQITTRNPLMPMAQLLTTFCVPAVAIAIAAGASSIPLIELAITAVAGDFTPIHLGVLLLPFLGGALVTAFGFGATVRSRVLPLFAWSGLFAIAGGAAVLLGVTSASQTSILVGTGLVGLGVGSSVAPALFTVGYTLHASQLPRVFAMLELLRGAAAFAAGPIILHLAETTGGSPAGGIRIAIWVCFAIAMSGATFSFYVFILGRGKLQTPDIPHWEDTGEPAWYSPPLFAGIRPHVSTSPTSNGNGGALSPGTREAARVEALFHAARLAHGDDDPALRADN